MLWCDLIVMMAVVRLYDTPQEAALHSAGVTHVYIGNSSRCPRVSARFVLADRVSVDVDVCFCRVPASALPSDTRPDEPVPTVDAVAALAVDEISKTALQGPLFLRNVVQDTLHTSLSGDGFSGAAGVSMSGCIRARPCYGTALVH